MRAKDKVDHYHELDLSLMRLQGIAFLFAAALDHPDTLSQDGLANAAMALQHEAYNAVFHFNADTRERAPSRK